MKNLVNIFFALAFVAIICLPEMANAQAPEKMSYQAVVRDANDMLVGNQSIGMQLSILQGSPSGTAVYVETQNPTSNINGLVTIEIGDGSVVSGDFSTIDWANGPYYLMSEIDPTGGSSYTISGTSQLLSVPYALHAATAETSTHAVSADHSMTSDSATHATTADHALVADSLSGFNTPQTYQIGDQLYGGTVFWVDETGQHGLIVGNTDADQFTGMVPYELTPQWDGTKWAYRGSGEMNTIRIIALNGYGDYAADIATRFLGISVNNDGLGSWYLPSSNEMALIYQNLVAPGTITLQTDAWYWTASEWSWAEAYGLDAATGIIAKQAKNINGHVRAIRRF